MIYWVNIFWRFIAWCCAVGMFIYVMSYNPQALDANGNAFSYHRRVQDIPEYTYPKVQDRHPSSDEAGSFLDR